MAQSISSTRALQAVRGREGTRISTDLCANQRAKRTHAYRHTSCPVLVWPPGRSSGGGREAKTTPTAEHLPSSCACRLTAQISEHITGWHIQRSRSNRSSSSSCVNKTMFRHKTPSLVTFHSTYAFLAGILEATFYAVPRCSITFGEMWWRSSDAGGQDGEAPRGAPLVDGRSLHRRPAAGSSVSENVKTAK